MEPQLITTIPTNQQQSIAQTVLENNNNAINQKESQLHQRRMSRTSNAGTQKTTPTSDNQSNKSQNDAHYAKNKAIQSPANRYRVSSE